VSPDFLGFLYFFPRVADFPYTRVFLSKSLWIILESSYLKLHGSKLDGGLLQGTATLRLQRWITPYYKPLNLLKHL